MDHISHTLDTENLHSKDDLIIKLLVDNNILLTQILCSLEAVPPKDDEEILAIRLKHKAVIETKLTYDYQLFLREKSKSKN